MNLPENQMRMKRHSLQVVAAKGAAKGFAKKAKKAKQAGQDQVSFRDSKKLVIYLALYISSWKKEM